jgi:DNA end-binding protein Ku
MEIKPAERKMAEQLIASMETEFDPAAFRDEYREALMAVIEAKVAGEAPKPAKKAEPTKIGDLMAALEASVAAARDARREGPAEVKAKPAAKAKPTAARKPAARKAKAAAAEEAAPARRRKTA